MNSSARLRAAVETAVREALVKAFSAVPASALPPTSPETAAAAAAVADALAEWHEHDLAAGEADLTERLAARHGPEFLRHPQVMDAIDWTLTADRGAHAAARTVFERDLADAFAASEQEREGRVDAILEAERGRVRARARTRVARATQGLLAAVRLPDEALEPLV